jgi:hypothetical protein
VLARGDNVYVVVCEALCWPLSVENTKLGSMDICLEKSRFPESCTGRYSYACQGPCLHHYSQHISLSFDWRMSIHLRSPLSLHQHILTCQGSLLYDAGESFCRARPTHTRSTNTYPISPPLRVSLLAFQFVSPMRPPGFVRSWTRNAKDLVPGAGGQTTHSECTLETGHDGECERVAQI